MVAVVAIVVDMSRVFFNVRYGGTIEEKVVAMVISSFNIYVYIYIMYSVYNLYTYIREHQYCCDRPCCLCGWMLDGWMGRTKSLALRYLFIDVVPVPTSMQYVICQRIM